MTIQRIQWTCPVCKRRFAIPATAPTPTRCPQCRQAEEEAAQARSVEEFAALASTLDDEPPPEPAPAITALAAIQLEVAEAATRGPSVAPIPRHTHPTLVTISTAYLVLAGLAVLGALAGLLFGFRAAFVMEPTPARTLAIFQSIAAFAGGIIAAMIFFSFREVIRVLLDIEHHTRPE